jgi:hypothetical protein
MNLADGFAGGDFPEVDRDVALSKIDDLGRRLARQGSAVW